MKTNPYSINLKANELTTIDLQGSVDSTTAEFTFHYPPLTQLASLQVRLRSADGRSVASSVALPTNGLLHGYKINSDILLENGSETNFGILELKCTSDLSIAYSIEEPVAEFLDMNKL